MKKLLLFVSALLMVSAANAQKWNCDKAHSNVKFNLTHMMLTELSGSFKNFDVTMTSSKEDFTDAQFDFSADVASVDTDNSMRDGHLQGDAHFDAAKFPKITFKSTGVQKVSAGKYKLMGDLTMKGKTLPITLDMVVKGPITDQRTQKPKIGLRASGTIDRSKWGVGGMPEAVVSNDIEIVVSGEFLKD